MEKPITEGTERQFILRLPQDVAGQVRQAIRDDELEERLQISDFSDMKEGLVHFDDITLSAKLMELPCILESHKTLDKKSLYKTGDICQVMMCTKKGADNDEQERPLKREHQYRKYQLNHGVTPPLKNVRKRRFRKTARKNKLLESPEVEKEVKRLIREDLAAINVEFKLVKQDEVPNTPSVASGDVSRCQTPAGSQKDTADKNQVNQELLDILEGVSSDSSNSPSDSDVEVAA